MHILVMDCQILLSAAEDFEGDIILALSLRPCLLPLTKWESCQLIATI